MDTRWFKGCNSEADREARRKEVMSFRSAFRELAELLEGLEEYTPDYDCPSWSHKQADANGANRKLKQILKLITIEEN